MSTRTDTQLVEAAQDGDVASFGVLYERYYDCMVAVAYSVTCDTHLAEDAAQQAFAVACAGLQSLRDKQKFAAWLAGICRNSAKQMFRSGRRTLALEQDVAAPPHDNDNEQEALVRQAVWKLGRGQRETVVLRFFKGLSYDRIAEVLGTSPEAVHGRLMRAKRKIAKQLKFNGNGFAGGTNET